MSLADHLRELRRRVVWSVLGLLAGAVVGWFVYTRLLDVLTAPIVHIQKARGDRSIGLNFSGLTQAFSVQLKVAIFVGIILSCPVWLYQIWAFIVPGLTKRERRTSMAFIAAAVPLFVAGCLLALWTMPRVVEVLYGFTPSGSFNFTNASDYLTFVTRFILAFGLAFLLPVLLVALNVAHVLPARVMIKGWRIAVMLIFVFAALMTPTPDAWTMLVLALPMVGLFYLAVGVSALLDRKRSKNDPDWRDVPDDEASPL
jgi:sec-independent protein translocase protein TatC